LVSDVGNRVSAESVAEVEGVSVAAEGVVSMTAPVVGAVCCGGATATVSELIVEAEKRAFGAKMMVATVIKTAPKTKAKPSKDQSFFVPGSTAVPPCRFNFVPSISQKLNSSPNDSLHTGQIFMTFSKWFK
jgi:hypothetical protein